MTGCSAPCCSSNTRTGMRFARFPSDPERRKKWLINCRRARWSPTPANRLCHLHFEESQFETSRKDGWRKLKPTAVPTIFNFATTQQPKTQCVMGTKSLSRFKTNVASDSQITALSEAWNSKNLWTHTVESSEVRCKGRANLVKLSSCFSSQVPQKVPVVKEDEDRFIPENTVVEKLQAQIRSYRQEVLHLKHKLRTETNQHLLLKKRLYKIFNADQISTLESSGFGRCKWSLQTLRKCFLIWCATGDPGYEYLQKIGFPFPPLGLLGVDLNPMNALNV